MAWSTREVARLAGTTLRTVRHYHEIGLLDEPERMPNGYKSYRTEHLVRLLEIRRLRRLGLPLSTVATVIRGSGDLNATLDAAEADLAATTAQLQRAQNEIAEMRRTPAKTDLPFMASVAATGAKLSTADRSLYAVITQVAGEQGISHWSSILRGFTRTPSFEEFDLLPADSDEGTRQRLAEQMAPHTAKLLAQNPLPANALPPSIREQSALAQTVIYAMLDLYTPRSSMSSRGSGARWASYESSGLEIIPRQVVSKISSISKLGWWGRRRPRRVDSRRSPRAGGRGCNPAGLR